MWFELRGQVGLEVVEDEEVEEEEEDILIKILSNVEDVRDNTTNDNRLHCIALSLFYFMSKMSEMCTITTNYNVNSNSKYKN